MKIVGFLIRLFLVVAFVVWLADRPGHAQIVWRDYEIDTSAAVLALIALALAYAAVLLHRLWRFVWDGPRFWRLRREINRHREGEEILGRGLAAIAAGQPVEAGRLAVKARGLLGETPISRLIQAQAAQLAGDHKTAKTLFETMTQDSVTAVLGYRGLIMSALKESDFDEVSRIILRLEKTKIEVPWLQLIRFEMGARMQNWGLAAEALAKARKEKALPAPQADRQEAALLLARAKTALRDNGPKEALVFAERARKLAPDWTPAAIILAEAQIVAKHERAALRTIERAWEQETHPQLVPLALWAAGSPKPIEAYKQIKKLTRHTRDKPGSLMALGEAALKAGLWGEARHYLMAVVSKGSANQFSYQLLARLERLETGQEVLASPWLLKAVSSPPEPRWLCASCGAAHEDWQATCSFCGAFNHLSWDVPGQRRHDTSQAAKAEVLDYLR